MSQFDNKMRRFEESILSTATRQRDEIIKETKRLQQSASEKARRDILVGTATNLKAEISDLESDYKIKLSQKSVEYRKALLNRRSEIAEQIFAEAKEKLDAFIGSPAYKDALCKKLSNLGAQYPYPGWELVLLPADEAIAQEVAAALGQSCTLSFEAESLTMGGFILRHKERNLVIDQSYGTLLEEQRKWFAANSGLKVTIEEGR